MSTERLDDFLERYKNNVASSKGVAKMLDALGEKGGEELFEKFTQEKGDASSTPHSIAPPVVTDASLVKKQEAKVFKWRRIWVYAAASVLLMATTAYWWYAASSKSDSVEAGYKGKEVYGVPGKDAALLTLANNKVVNVSEAALGVIASEEDMDIIKLDSGWLMYKVNGSAEMHKAVYNTLTTPRGGQYKLILPDGSRVWLNAESSLSYEIDRGANARKVHLTGEAYFEVTGNSKQPFTVATESCNIGVLGTSFNVHAYKNEHTIKTTLLAGSVVIENGGASKQLIPGQQAVLVKGQQQKDVKVLDSVDVNAVIAWKNNVFVFNGDIKDAMLQVGRWYNVSVVFEEDMNVPLIATVPRNIPLPKLLELLSQTGSIQFAINGNKVLVRKIEISK
ncbi:FecR family protein [Filimonas lacunae]|uniref:FecR family protein n=1 Tax=Filimonas lacunae TaxID=477680 RepID=A0A173MRL8_9BACT|nr:FecR family protein [Filimonas lacunae]BAV10090.1 anti-sigma factor [Filimonas lacunae]SIS83860.1 FecR family protein [Filimonas lacunae]